MYRERCVIVMKNKMFEKLLVLTYIMHLSGMINFLSFRKKKCIHYTFVLLEENVAVSAYPIVILLVTWCFESFRISCYQVILFACHFSHTCCGFPSTVPVHTCQISNFLLPQSQIIRTDIRSSC